MSTNVDLETLRRQWRADSEPAGLAEDLESRVLRQSRGMVAGLIVPVLVTVGVGGYVLYRAVRLAQAADILLAVEVWLFIALIWAGCIWIARGTWRPLGKTTAAFVDLSIRRCRANVNAARFGAWLYVGQLLFNLAWLFEYTATSVAALLTSWPVIVLGWIGLPAFLAGMVWFVRRQRRQLANLLELEPQLSGGDATS